MITSFVTATGTGVGKTFFTRGLARALRKHGKTVAAIKPIETGCDPDPLDALALAAACDTPSLAHAAGLYRATPALGPRAIQLRGGPAVPPLGQLVQASFDAAGDCNVLLIEGAGGVLVPLNERETMADFIRVLGAPVLLVAPNRLGVQSDVLAALEALRRRDLHLLGVVLPDLSARDESCTDNGDVIREHARVDVFEFAHCADDDDALAAAVEQSGVLSKYL